MTSRSLTHRIRPPRRLRNAAVTGVCERTSRHTLWLLVLGITMAACREQPHPSTVTVFAAASLSDVLPAVAHAWQVAGGQPVAFSFDGSSRLARAIEQGAPADLFISADETWMDKLATQRLIDTTTRRDLLRNRLVLIAAAKSTLRVSTAADLRSLAIHHLALAGEQVPAARYAAAALRQLHAWDALVPRVVRGDNVRTALAWVAEGTADAGIVYLTDAMEDPRVRVVYAFPDSSHPPIVYPGAVTANAIDHTAAAAFLAFCQTPTARTIFRRAGFTN